ncbi:hypothetical protein B0H67DRAFT_582416, partial [Lasiosphaeris hirsuta]
GSMGRLWGSLSFLLIVSGWLLDRVILVSLCHFSLAFSLCSGLRIDVSRSAVSSYCKVS